MINLKQPLIDNKEIEAAVEVLKSGVLAQGPVTKRFEDEFALKCGTKYAIALNSGTAALHSILSSLGIGPGDEVICPAFTFIASASPIVMCGAKPVFVDIDLETFNISPESVSENISPNTKAVIAVNLFGNLANYRDLQKICDQFSIYLLEDAAQSHFARLNESYSGSLADASWFSFYATKNMMTIEGGMVTTNNIELVEKIKRFRQHGMSGLGMYDYEDLGYNYRTNDLLSSIGLVQLSKIDSFNKSRIKVAKIFNQELSMLENITVPSSSFDGEHVFHLYTIRTSHQKHRDLFIAKLKENNIGCGVYYPTPLSELSVFKRIGSGKELCNARKASQTVFSIPCEPFLKDQEIELIIKVIKDIHSKLD